MNPPIPIPTIHLFPVLQGYLLSLLRSLTSDDWYRPTLCKDWSVKDIAAHLLDGDTRRIALHRDGYTAPPDQSIHSYADLVAYLNQLNADWVRAARRLSPALLIDLLDASGREVYTCLNALPPFGIAAFPVAWAGDTVSPNWFDIAREYTERWHQQEQIRLAVGQPDGIMTAELYHPLLDTFMQALPHTYRYTPAATGTQVQIRITGEGGGVWTIARHPDNWQLTKSEASPSAQAVVTLAGPIAWQLFTKGISREAARLFIRTAGDEALTQPVLRMRAVMK